MAKNDIPRNENNQNIPENAPVDLQSRSETNETQCILRPSLKELN